MVNELADKFDSLSFDEVKETDQTKLLFKSAVVALKSPNAREVQFRDDALRKIVAFRSHDKKMSVIVDMRIVVIKDESEIEEKKEGFLSVRPYVHVAWIDETTKTAGSYVFIEKSKKVIVVGSPYIQSHHLKRWNEGEVWENSFFMAMYSPPEAEVNKAIEVLRHGERDNEFRDKCIELRGGAFGFAE